MHLVDTASGTIQRLGGGAAEGPGGAHDGRVRRVAFGPGVLYSLSGEPQERARLWPNTVRSWLLERSDRSGDQLLESPSELWDLAVAPAGEALLVVDRSRGRVRLLPTGPN